MYLGRQRSSLSSQRAYRLCQQALPIFPKSRVVLFFSGDFAMVVPAERDISNLREDVSHLANRHLAHPCPLPPFLLSSSSFLVCSFLCFKVSHLGTTLYSLAS